MTQSTQTNPLDGDLAKYQVSKSLDKMESMKLDFDSFINVSKRSHEVYNPVI